MAKLPSISGRKVVKAFRSMGWEVARQESSHIIMVKEGEKRSQWDRKSNVTINVSASSCAAR